MCLTRAPFREGLAKHTSTFRVASFSLNAHRPRHACCPMRSHGFEHQRHDTQAPQAPPRSHDVRGDGRHRHRNSCASEDVQETQEGTKCIVRNPPHTHFAPLSFNTRLWSNSPSCSDHCVSLMRTAISLSRSRLPSQRRLGSRAKKCWLTSPKSGLVVRRAFQKRPFSC